MAKFAFRVASSAFDCPWAVSDLGLEACGVISDELEELELLFFTFLGSDMLFCVPRVSIDFSMVLRS